MSISGYVYCFSNETMPGILKCGMTDRTPEERLKDSNSCTWCLPTWKIEFAKKVKNPLQKEAILHTLLEKYTERVHPRREFFRTSVKDVRTFFDLMDGRMWGEDDEDNEDDEEHDEEEDDDDDDDEDYSGFNSFIKDRYDITGNKTDSIPSRDIVEYITTECKMRITPNKIGRLLSKMIKIVNKKCPRDRNPKGDTEIGKQRLGIKCKCIE
jgi:hypothetical protein